MNEPNNKKFDKHHIYTSSYDDDGWRPNRDQVARDQVADAINFLLDVCKQQQQEIVDLRDEIESLRMEMHGK